MNTNNLADRVMKHASKMGRESLTHRHITEDGWAVIADGFRMYLEKTEDKACQDCVYPNWHYVLSMIYPAIETIVSSDCLLTALKACHAIKSTHIDFAVNGKLIVKGEDGYGEAQTTWTIADSECWIIRKGKSNFSVISCYVKQGPDMECIRFNLDYITEAVKWLDEPVITIKFQKSNTLPIILETDNRKVILMPMNIDGLES